MGVELTGEERTRCRQEATKIVLSQPWIYPDGLARNAGISIHQNRLEQYLREEKEQIARELTGRLSESTLNELPSFKKELAIARATEDEIRASGTSSSKVTVEFEGRMYRLLPSSPQRYSNGKPLRLERYGYAQYADILSMEVRSPVVEYGVLSREEVLEHFQGLGVKSDMLGTQHPSWTWKEWAQSGLVHYEIPEGSHQLGGELLRQAQLLEAGIRKSNFKYWRSKVARVFSKASPPPHCLPTQLAWDVQIAFLNDRLAASRIPIRMSLGDTTGLPSNYGWFWMVESPTTRREFITWVNTYWKNTPYEPWRNIVTPQEWEAAVAKMYPTARTKYAVEGKRNIVDHLDRA